MKTAMYRGREITAEEAVDVRDRAERHAVDFRCVECDKPAKVMRQGKSGRPAAHFEHHERNDHCSLVHHIR
jgi:hypothetical protein